MDILNAYASRVRNPDGSYTATIGACPVRFRDDNAEWQDVIPGSNAALPDNCEFVPIAGGYRLWKPNGTPPYESGWLDTDYWLEVTDESGVSTYSTLRGSVIEQAVLANAGSPHPAWRWRWNTNLTHRINGDCHEWLNLVGDVIFTKRAPRAWSEANPRQFAIGAASVDSQGIVTVDIDMSGLSYPIVLDPTTDFNAATSDRSPYRTNATWATARSAPADDSDQSPNDIFGVVDASAGYEVDRYLASWDTSALGAGAVISAATLAFFSDGATTNANATSIVVTDGTYPIPPGVTNFKDLSFANCGSMLRSAWITNNWNTITLNATGIAAINKAGTTKLALVDGLDLSDSTAPTGGNRGRFQSADHTGNHPPKLSVTYTLSSGNKVFSGSSSSQALLLS